MKTLFKSLALLTTCLLSAPSHAATFSLEVVSNQIRVGEFFDVNLVVSDLFTADPTDLLLAFGLNTISSAPGLAQFQGAGINPLFSNDPEILYLHAAGSALPGIAFADIDNQPTVLTTLRFLALAPGQFDIQILSDLNDSNQGLFLLNQGQLAINASSNFVITAVPLPPTALMFLGGLAITACGLRKRS